MKECLVVSVVLNYRMHIFVIYMFALVLREIPGVTVFVIYRHSLSVTPDPIICPSLLGSFSLSVCPAIKAYITVTMSWTFKKLGESVGTYIGLIYRIKISLRYAPRALHNARNGSKG